MLKFYTALILLNSAAGPVLGLNTLSLPAVSQIAKPEKIIISKIGIKADVEEVGSDKLKRILNPELFYSNLNRVSHNFTTLVIIPLKLYYLAVKKKYG